jgi:pimeloyl-ACP methyl ester carboxylesterase
VEFQRRYVDARGARLSVVDFGGHGPPVLLLHGLCGQALEWGGTAAWLSASHRVFALDLRAHGQSEKGVANLSPWVFVADTLETLALIADEPVVLIGQSMGGVVAYRTALEDAATVRALVVVEAQAWGNVRADAVAVWLREWPVPFASRAEGRAWLDAQGLVGEVWAEVLEERDGGWYPQFRLDDMLRIVAAEPADDRRDWNRIKVPALVVHGERSATCSKDVLRAMAASIPHGEFVQIAGAGHDVHLEKPPEWRAALERFLTGIA